MKVVWTNLAAQGWQEVALYILQSFGAKALQDFEQRTYDAEKEISLMPNIGAIEWNDSKENVTYRYIVINRRSKMLYFIEKDTLYIADFWDVRQNR